MSRFSCYCALTVGNRTDIRDRISSLLRKEALESIIEQGRLRLPIETYLLHKVMRKRLRPLFFLQVWKGKGLLSGIHGAFLQSWAKEWVSEGGSSGLNL